MSKERRQEKIRNMVAQNKKVLLRLAATAVVVAIVIVGAVNFVKARAASSSYLTESEVIKVGLRTNILGFAVSEGGSITGYDRDVIEELLTRTLGDEIEIAHVPLYSENAGAAVKYGQTQLSMGLLVDGTDRVEGWTMTAPYYNDSVLAVLSPGAGMSGVESLEGKNIGILNSMINVDVAEEFLQGNDLEAEVTRYYDYESAKLDLNAGIIDYFLAPEAVTRQHFSEYDVYPASLFTVGYGILLPSGQDALKSVFDDRIGEMRSDGTLETLQNKYGIVEGSG